MIEINLIPPELRRKKAQGIGGKFNLPPEVVVGLGGGLIMLLVLLHILLVFVNFGRLAQYKALKNEWEKTSPEKEKVDKTVKEMRALQAKLKSTQEVLGTHNFL